MQEGEEDDELDYAAGDEAEEGAAARKGADKVRARPASCLPCGHNAHCTLPRGHDGYCNLSKRQLSSEF